MCYASFERRLYGCVCILVVALEGLLRLDVSRLSIRQNLGAEHLLQTGETAANFLSHNLWCSQQHREGGICGPHSGDTLGRWGQ